MQILYRQMDVWKKDTPDQAIRYRIFQRLCDGHYAVQSADFFQGPIEQKKVEKLDRQLIELFTEEDISEREQFMLRLRKQ